MNESPKKPNKPDEAAETTKIGPDEIKEIPKTAEQTADEPSRLDEQKIKKREEKKVESLRERFSERSQEETDRFADLVKKVRLLQPAKAEPVPLTPEQKELITETAISSETELKKNYEAGYGIAPTSDPKGNFYKQVWTRDLGHAVGNYFANKKPKAAADSFKTVFKHQREDGMLPFRVEKVYGLLKVLPIVRILAQPLFSLIQKRIRKVDERPRYEGQSGSSAQDTVPTTIIAIGEFFINSPEGREFVKEHYDQITKAVDFFRGKADPRDDLISVKKGNADWADSIMRAGKLGNINVWWARSLRLMEFMANDLGREEDAEKYRNEFHRVKNNLIEKLYNREEGYFRAEEGKNRVDTVASIFGSLYLLNPTEAAKVQETLKLRMKTSIGLKNFDPPYTDKEIDWKLRLGGHGGYHNEYVWPWVTCQNIQAKIKIALQHPDQNVKNKYKEEAIKDLTDMARLFKETGGAYEIYDPKTNKPATSKRFFISTYNSQKDIMGNLAAYQGAYNQLEKLGWI